jgi:hypothetical protein
LNAAALEGGDDAPTLPTPGTVGSGMVGGGADGGPMGLLGRREVRLLRLRTRADLGFAFVFNDLFASVRGVVK